MDTKEEYSFIFESKFREWNDVRLREFQTTDGTKFSMYEMWIVANRKKRQTPLQKILFRKENNYHKIYRISVEISTVSDPRTSKKFKVSRNTNPVSTSIIVLLKKYRRLKLNDEVKTNVYGVEVSERILNEDFRYRIILVRAQGPPERGYPKVDGVLALSRDLGKLLETGNYSDLVLTDGSVEMRLHRDIVFARFEYGKNLKQNWQKNDEDIIKINLTSSRVMRELIHYIYTGTTRPMDFDTLHDLYTEANKYLLFGLKEMLSIQINRRINSLNAVAVLALAELHNEVEMKASCLDIIVENFNEILLTEGWKCLKNNEHIDSTIKLLSEIREALIQRFGPDINEEPFIIDTD